VSCSDLTSALQSFAVIALGEWPSKTATSSIETPDGWPRL